MKYNAKDTDGYRILIHALKTTSATIGAADLSGKAKDLEMAAKEGNTEYIEGHHKECMKLFETIAEGLSQAFKDASEN